MNAAIGFGPFVIANAGLSRDGRPVALGQRALALLTALAEAEGAVSKQALMEAGWPGSTVEEGNLSVQIAALRKALGTRDDGGEWIVTVPRLGYRLVRGELAPAATAGSPGLPVLAVLPFESIGSDAELDAFAEGLVEELVAALSRFKGFTVLARTATNRFKGAQSDIREMARELGAGYLVEGSVRRAGAQLRVAMRLARGASAATAWSHSFEGKLDDPFVVQDNAASVAAAQISRAVRQSEVSRSAQERPASGHAYDLMQRGIALLEALNDDANRQAIALLEQAVALDPRRGFTLIMAAWSYEQRVHAGWTASAAEEARCLELARGAIALGGDDATILGHGGIALQLCGGEWENGLQTTLRGVDINPNSHTALFFAGVAQLTGGTLADARDCFERASVLASDDEAANPLSGLAHVELCEGRFELAASIAERAVVMRPRFFWPHWALIAANAQLGRLDDAGKALAIYRAADDAASLGRIRHGQRSRDPERHANLIEGLRLAGMPES